MWRADFWQRITYLIGMQNFPLDVNFLSHLDAKFRGEIENEDAKIA